jgi:hypothetical protein
MAGRGGKQTIQIMQTALEKLEAQNAQYRREASGYLLRVIRERDEARKQRDELFAALQGLLGCVNVRIDDPRMAAFDAARAAIAKARGEQSEPDGPDPSDLARDYNDSAEYANNHDATT